MGLDSGMVDELDAKTRAALAQLTEREKDCLRRRLYPQTAKEMALEIGVSPHAVENTSRYHLRCWRECRGHSALL